MKYTVKIAFYVALIVFFASCAKLNSFASEIQSGPYIIVDSYNVEGDVVIPGTNFKLTLKVKNTDDIRIARGVVVSISGSTGIVPAYKEIPQAYIRELAPGEIREIEYKLFAQDSCQPPSALFSVSILSETTNNGVVISVPVESKQERISVISTKVPNKSYIGGAITSSIRFKTVGDDSYSNITMEVFVDGELYDSYSIGNMSQGAVKTQNATVYINEPGQHELTYSISCTDSSGEISQVEAYRGVITLDEVVSTNSNVDVQYVENHIYHSNKDIGIITGCGLGAIICLAGIVIVLRKNR